MLYRLSYLGTGLWKNPRGFIALGPLPSQARVFFPEGQPMHLRVAHGGRTDARRRAFALAEIAEIAEMAEVLQNPRSTYNRPGKSGTPQ